MPTCGKWVSNVPFKIVSAWQYDVSNKGLELTLISSVIPLSFTMKMKETISSVLFCIEMDFKGVIKCRFRCLYILCFWGEFKVSKTLWNVKNKQKHFSRSRTSLKLNFIHAFLWSLGRLWKVFWECLHSLTEQCLSLTVLFDIFIQQQYRSCDS